MAYNIDLHTHSLSSPDGALGLTDYRQMLQTKRLDFIAVTDHNTIAAAITLRAKLGEAIIVGEEITTTEGELIGLYLTKVIPDGLSPEATILQIKAQNGLVMAPHPFETVRKGVSPQTLERIIDEVDIIEVGNGRAVFQNRAELAKEWAVRYQKAGAANSDAHGAAGWGRTYSTLSARPSRETLVKLLHGSTYTVGTVGVRGVLYPKLNRLRKHLGLLLGDMP